MTLDSLIELVPQFDRQAADAAKHRQDRLTKPTGSLGRLEDLSVQIAGITGQALPSIEPPAIFVFAGDHEIARSRAVSAYPIEVTAQMVANFAAGGAVITVLARQIGAWVVVADFGVACDLSPDLPIQHRKVRHGAADWTTGPAMSPDQAAAALLGGAECVFDEQKNHSLGIACIGEMGIGNTTTAAALAAAYLAARPEEVAGRGTGIDDTGLTRKIAAIYDGLAHHADTIGQGDPLAILAALGGLEIAAMAGGIIAAASLRIPILVDGFISSAAALAATKIAPAVRPFLIAAHCSVERGHRLILDDLGLAPLLNLDMRLGEASGAALAMPIVRAALAVLRETATFEEAGVSDRE